MRPSLLLLLLAFLLTLSHAQQHPLPFSLCGPDKLGLHFIALNEWPVVPGKDVVITASYTPNVTVNGGKALATVHVLGIPLTETRDICSEPGVSCPLVKNKPTTTILHDYVPGLTPGLGVSVRVEIFDEAGEKLTCVEVHVDVKTHPLIGLPGWAKPSPSSPLFASSSSSFYSSSSSSSSMMLVSSLPGRSTAVTGVGGGGVGGGMIMAMEQYVQLRMPKALAVAAEIGVGDRRVEKGEEGGGGVEAGHAMLRRGNDGRA